MAELSVLAESFDPPVNIRDYDRTHDPQRPHLTSIIRSIEEGLKSGGGGRKAASFVDMDSTQEVGFLWEDVLGMVYARNYVQTHVDEIELDGIIMTPDGVGPDPHGVVTMVLEEYKVTWRSAKRDPLMEWKWMTQVKSYCKALGVSVVVMRVLYVMGRYDGSGPRHYTYRIEFDQVEIDNNWNMIRRHRNIMVEEEDASNDGNG